MKKTKTTEPEATGLRGFLEKFGLPLAGLLVLAAVALAAYTLFGGKPGVQEQGAYYSGDDGATFYAGPRDRVPPFTQGGTEHVRAYVGRPRDGGEERVLYLMKYRPEAAEAVQRAEDNNLRPPSGGQLVKRPGDAEWLDAEDPKNAERVRAIRDTRMADGTVMVLVNPES